MNVKTCGDASPRRSTKLPGRAAVTLGIGLALLATTVGISCRKAPSAESSSQSEAAEDTTYLDQLFQIAVRNLNHVEEFETDEMLKQSVDRLNQWIKHQPSDRGWKPDPMVETLSAPLRDLPVIKGLGQTEFHVEPPYGDGWTLQEAVWLRELSRWARGGSFDALDQAKRLFDWTICNIQLDPEPIASDGTRLEAVIQRPWETLLLGRGSAADRAHVFILLARQQGISAAALAMGDPSDASKQQVLPGLVGVLHKGQLYLFDLKLGLPIPGPHGIRRTPEGQLGVQPATLAQVAADDSLLRQLDADNDLAYPLKAADLKEVVVLLDASPAALSRRMALVESHLVGEERLRLTYDPSADAKRFKAVAHVAGIRLWPWATESILQEMSNRQARARWQTQMMLPFQSPAGPAGPLWKGRVHHLKGHFTGTPNAVEFYQAARVSQNDLNAAQIPEPFKDLFRLAKLDASYWLGLIAAYQGNAPSAVDYLQTRTLEAIPGNLWTSGAQYNLARVYEDSDRPEKAIELYRANRESSVYHGNLLRAKWLESLESPAKAEVK